MPGPLAASAPPIPDTIRVLELSGSGPEALHVVERPTPRPGPSQALCRVEAASVCASDAKLVRLGGRHRNLHGGDPARWPVVPGHAGSLVVAQVGERLRNRLRPGQRLVVAPNLPGPPRFDRDRYGARPEEVSRVSVGFTLPGLLAEYVLLREDVLEAAGHLVPISAPPSVLPHFGAALAEPFSTVVAAHAHMVHVLRGAIDGERAYRAGVLPGGVTVIVGAGPMGLLHAAYALLRRPRLIVLSEPRADRRAAAQAFGTRAREEDAELVAVEPAELRGLVLARTGGRGADDVIITAGSSAAEEEGISLAAPGGCVSLFASNSPDDATVRVNAAELHYRSTSISGTSGGEPLDLQRAIDLQERGAVDLSPFVAAVGGISAASAALRAVLEARFAGKVIIYPRAAAPELVQVAQWGPRAEESFLEGAR